MCVCVLFGFNITFKKISVTKEEFCLRLQAVCILADPVSHDMKYLYITKINKFKQT